MKKIAFIILFALFLQGGVVLKAQNPKAIMHFYITDFEHNNSYGDWLTDTLNPWVIDTTNAKNIWQIGKPNKPDFDSAYTIPNAMVTDTLKPYPTNNHSTFEFNIKKPWWNMHRGWSHIILLFLHKYETDSLCDGGYIDISYDGGLTFTNIIFDKNATLSSGQYSVNDTISGGKPAFSGKSSGWQYSEFSIIWPEEEWSDVDSMIYRFNFKSDSINTNKAGWLIDNIYFLLEGYIGIGVNDKEASMYLNIYPNPILNELNIDILENNKIKRIEIFSITGEMIHVEEINNKSKLQIDFTEHTNGLYILKAYDKQQNQYFTKIIKQ